MSRLDRGIQKTGSISETMLPIVSEIEPKLCKNHRQDRID